MMIEGSGDVNSWYFQMYVYQTNLTVNVRKIKLEKGNKATDYTQAPEDVQDEIDAKKSVHTLTAYNSATATTQYTATYSQILAWAQEGRAGLNAWLDSISGVNIGDTVRLAFVASDMNNAIVYIVAEVTFKETTSGKPHILFTSHGLDTTVIDGGHILTGTIDANKVNIQSLTIGSAQSGWNDLMNSNIDVGGRNLVWDTSWLNVGTRWSDWGSPTTREIVSINSKRWLHLVTTTAPYQGYQQNEDKRSGDGEVTAGDVVIVSFFAYARTAGQKATVGIHWRNSSNTIVSQAWLTQSLTTSEERYSEIFTVPSSAVSFNIMVGDNTTTAQELWIAQVQLEKGNKITDWSPAPEDVDVRNYISASSSGIRIASANPATQNQRIELTNAQITFFDSDNNNRMYITKSNVVAGRLASSHSVFNDSGLGIYDSNAKLRSKVDTDGLNVYDTDGSTNVAHFGASARVGRTDRQRVVIEPTGIDMYGYNASAPTPNENLCHIGFESGTAQSGTAIRPYFTFGYRDTSYSTTKGNYSVAMGNRTEASGWNSIALGPGARAAGNNSIALGSSSIASSTNSCGIDGGHSNGSYAVAIINGSLASGSYSAAIGQGITTAYSNQIAVGKYNSNGSGNAFELGWGTTSTPKNIFHITTAGAVYVNGTSVHSSDRRLKEHLGYLGDEAVDFINGLKPAHYIKDGSEHVGFYAQDVEKIDKWNCMIGEKMNGYMTLGYMELFAPLVTYVQKLEERITELERSR